MGCALTALANEASHLTSQGLAFSDLHDIQVKWTFYGFTAQRIVCVSKLIAEQGSNVLACYDDSSADLFVDQDVDVAGIDIHARSITVAPGLTVRAPNIRLNVAMGKYNFGTLSYQKIETWANCGCSAVETEYTPGQGFSGAHHLPSERA